MKDNPNKYFKKKKVVNFEIINHECRSDPLKKSYKEHQTEESEDLKNKNSIRFVQDKTGWFVGTTGYYDRNVFKKSLNRYLIVRK